MESNSNLLNLIEYYIKEYKGLLEKYHQGKITCALYKELINLLTSESIEENKISISILLNTIYGDNIYVDEFYNIIYKDSEEELKKFIEKIVREYNATKEENKKINTRINRNHQMFTSAKRVRACIKYKTAISNGKNDIFNIKRILSYYETSGIISNKEELLLINEIELHNRKIALNRKLTEEEKEYTQSLYNEIPNILNIGYQEHDVIEVAQNRKNSLDKFVIEIINLINYFNTFEISELLESYKKYNLENNEYNYIIIKILDTYLEELITLYELLIDKDVYSYRSERNEVIKNYYLTLDKYIKVRNYYNMITEYVSKEEEIEPIINEESSTEENEKILVYSHSEVNITKARFISDMSNIIYEYYEDIYELLMKFKNGNISDKMIKVISNGNNGDKNDGYRELKYDDIRIIIKHIKDNIYSVVGVFIKKGNNNTLMYKKIMNRSIPDISTEEKLHNQLELSVITENKLDELVQEKARSNGRK